jgi:hypothetical protein
MKSPTWAHLATFAEGPTTSKKYIVNINKWAQTCPQKILSMLLNGPTDGPISFTIDAANKCGWACFIKKTSSMCIQKTLSVYFFSRSEIPSETMSQMFYVLRGLGRNI